MEDNMLNRLLAAEKRLTEIDNELMSDEATKNIAHFRELSKERSYLEKQVDVFHQYQKAQSDYKDALEVCKELDIPLYRVDFIEEYLDNADKSETDITCI